MVLFANVVINQKVEIMRAGVIYTGTVRYKGSLNGISGDWVGIELDEPVGLHTGMINGRRYFLCPDRHGIFTTASQLRFIPLKQRLANRYRPIWTGATEVDEELFSPTSRTTWADRDGKESWNIDAGYAKKAVRADFKRKDDQYSRKYYPLRHMISAILPSAVMLQPELERSKCFGSATGRSTPIDSPYIWFDPDSEYIPAPSIPKTHMPHEALKRQAGHGWMDGAHYPREMSVNTGRDSIKFSQWNDIS